MSWFLMLLALGLLGGAWAKLDRIQSELLALREEVRALREERGT